jgi:TetR/AcrR family transcriptional regulator, transcriptional repressor of bet genes
MSKAKPIRSVESATERASRPRQRQKLIDACISALYAYGPSRTTVDKVVAIAEMSPGIVSFYFDSKAAMLVAALQFLADEFEQQVLAPVAALSAEPVKALERLVALMLDPDIASPRKVSVWYSFWGEANSRQEYYDICGNKDDAFAATVRDLIERVMVEARNPDLDGEAVALGLIGVLEIQWQSIAFQEEANIDRKSAERRALAYLRSVFPRQFAGRGTPEKRVAVSLVPAAEPPAAPLPGWAYDSAELHGHERRELFLPAWHFAGLERAMAAPGDYLTIETPGERALVLRGTDGQLAAFHNNCRHRPHALVAPGSGHFDGAITCPIDGAAHGLDGDGLHPLDLAASGGSMFLRFLAGSATTPVIEAVPAGLPVSAETIGQDVAADWKAILEQLLETGFAETPGCTLTVTADGLTWAAAQITRRCSFPNMMIETRPGGLSVWQVRPLAPGRARLDCTRYGAAGSIDPDQLKAVAESTQIGLASSFYVPDSMGSVPPALAAFRRWLRAHLPPAALRG